MNNLKKIVSVVFKSNTKKEGKNFAGAAGPCRYYVLCITQGN